MKLKYKKGDLKILNFVALLFAGAVNACGVTLLLAPVGLYDSGVSGLAMFLDMLIEVMPLWSWLIIINFPIFLFGMKKQGVAFTVYSLFAIAAYSLFSLLFQNIIPVFVPDFLTNGSPIVGNETLLCCVFGGILSGIGSGLTIRFGGTMDGMETLGVIFAKRLNLTVGNFVMIFNVLLYLVIGVTVISTGKGDFSIPLYSIIAYFVNGKA
ncbi:MAG: YitT family protein, partial [Candidatus Coproplasma sp.]